MNSWVQNTKFCDSFMSSKTVAVIGATGVFGKEISLSLLKLGHRVVAFTRSTTHKKGIIQELERAGAMVMEFPDYTDETALTDIFRHNKVDTIISAILGTAPNLKHVGGHLIDAAVKSGTVERFCPNSFGIHIGAIPWGISKMVDAKKEMQEKVRDSGMKWTNILVGGLFSYFLPSLRNGHGSVGSFDHIDTVFHSNSVEDAGLMIALAATDDRTVNKYVHVQYNPSTQSKNLALVKRLWPNHEFPEKHLDEFELIRLMHEDSDNDIWGVLYAVFCMGRTNCADFRGTILGNTIMPSDFKCTTIEECLSDPSFVFLDHP